MRRETHTYYGIFFSRRHHQNLFEKLKLCPETVQKQANVTKKKKPTIDVTSCHNQQSADKRNWWKYFLQGNYRQPVPKNALIQLHGLYESEKLQVVICKHAVSGLIMNNSYLKRRVSAQLMSFWWTTILHMGVATKKQQICIISVVSQRHKTNTRSLVSG